MKPRILVRIVLLLLSIALFSFHLTPVTEVYASEQKLLVVFLVRHGEKVDLSEDAKLSDAGQERAALLAKILRSTKIEHVHSSDFIRTRSTAFPTADWHGLRVEIYDPYDLPGLAEKLRKVGGRHLVVGHSTTTPPMVELLGGDPGSKINEAGEFDRLYIVTVGSDGHSSSVMLRYGREFNQGQ